MPTKRTTKCGRRRCRTKKSGRTKRKTQKPKNNKGKRMGTHRGKRKEKRGGNGDPVLTTPQQPAEKNKHSISPNPNDKIVPAHGMHPFGPEELFGPPTPPPSP